MRHFDIRSFHTHLISYKKIPVNIFLTHLFSNVIYTQIDKIAILWYNAKTLTKRSPMTTRFNLTLDEIDCARKYVNDIRQQFEGWTIQQILDHFEQEESWAEYTALKKAYHIVQNAKRAIKIPHIHPTFQSLLQSKQLGFRLQVVLPYPPAQTQKQQLKTGTSLPSIVSPRYDKFYRGTNWPHFENRLKLFTLDYLIKGELTPQQKKDKTDLEKAIEKKGNTTARGKGSCMEYAQDIIRALADPDPDRSQYKLRALRDQIDNTPSEPHAKQLYTVMTKAQSIYTLIRTRYRTK